MLAAVLVVGALGGLTMLAVDRSGAAVTGQVDARAQDATTAAQAFADSRVDLLEQLVAGYAQRPEVREAVAAGELRSGAVPVTTALHQLQTSAPGLIAAWVTDERGLMLATDTGVSANLGEDFSYRDWFQGARGSDAAFLSPGYVGRDPQQTEGFAVSVVVRSSDEPGAPVIGVLGTSMSLEAFQTVFDGAAPTDGSMLISDQQGQVLASSGLTVPLLSDRSDDPGFDEALAGRTSLHRSDRWVQVHAPLGRGWIVSTALPASLADAPNRQLTAAIGAAGAGAALCLLAALLVLARVLRSRAQAQGELTTALAEVQARRRYTDTVLDTLNVSVVVCDATGTLTYMNRLGREWHGIDALTDDPGAEAWGSRYGVTHVDGSPVRADEWPLVRAMSTREGAEAELVMSTQGQAPPRILVLARPLLAQDGTLDGAVTGSHDVTAARRQEAELEQARDTAVEASQAKTSFLAAMSHEIRTPLNGVLGMLDLVVHDASLADVHRERLEIAAASGRTLLQLLNDVLDMSRGEVVRLTLAQRSTSLVDLVNSAASVVSGPAEAKDLLVRVLLDPELPDRVMTDPDRLMQVLLNLLGNAVKFTDRGTVTLTATTEPRRRATGQPNAPLQLVLSVADTGPGMTEAECGRVFRPFEQGSAGRAKGGTGLGLALTSQLIELFHGTITVTSHPGAGSTFTVVLPLQPDVPRAGAPTPAVVPAPRERHSGVAAMHVLVAEDNDINQLVMEHTLAALGVTVELVDDGGQAVDRVLSGVHYDAVFLDWQMPVMDGPDVARALRAAGCRTPLIGLTARTSPDDVQTCLAAGMDHVLPKPCPRADLVETLRRLSPTGLEVIAPTP